MFRWLIGPKEVEVAAEPDVLTLDKISVDSYDIQGHISGDWAIIGGNGCGVDFCNYWDSTINLTYKGVVVASSYYSRYSGAWFWSTLSTDNENTQKIIDVLTRAGIVANAVRDAKSERWHKEIEDDHARAVAEAKSAFQ